MNIFSILISTVMVAISTQACRVGCPNPFSRLLIDIEESEAKGNINRSKRLTDPLNKPKVSGIGRQESGDWLVFMYPYKLIGNSSYFIGLPRISKNGYGEYSDYAVLDKAPELFMITDMNGNGLKLRDVEKVMSVKIRAKKSHFVDHVYLSAYEDEDGKPAGRIYYDVLKPTGEDNKQEWIVLTDKEDTEPFFAFQSAYSPNKFLSGDNGPLLYLGSGGWNVQRFY